MLSQIFVTFGVLILLRGLAQFFWKVDYRMIPQTMLSGNINVFDVYIGIPQLVAAGGAILCNGLIFWFLKSTKLGMALEAVSEDKEAARLMGINSDRMFALAWGIGIATVGVAGISAHELLLRLSGSRRQFRSDYLRRGRPRRLRQCARGLHRRYYRGDG